jgi:hypothetical protein
LITINALAGHNGVIYSFAAALMVTLVVYLLLYLPYLALRWAIGRGQSAGVRAAGQQTDARQ